MPQSSSGTASVPRAVPRSFLPTFTPNHIQLPSWSHIRLQLGATTSNTRLPERFTELSTGGSYHSCCGRQQWSHDRNKMDVALPSLPVCTMPMRKPTTRPRSSKRTPSRTNHCLALAVPDRKHDLRYTHNDVIPEANHRRTTRQLRSLLYELTALWQHFRRTGPDPRLWTTQKTPGLQENPHHRGTLSHLHPKRTHHRHLVPTFALPNWSSCPPLHSTSMVRLNHWDRGLL